MYMSITVNDLLRQMSSISEGLLSWMILWPGGAVLEKWHSSVTACTLVSEPACIRLSAHSKTSVRNSSGMFNWILLIFFSGMKLTGVWIFTLSFLDRLMALFDFLFLCMELVRMVMKMLFIADPIHLFFCIFLPEIPLEKSCPQFHLYLLFSGNIVGFLAMIWRYLCGLHFYSGIFYIITAFLALNYSLWLINTSNKHGLL